MPILAKGTQFKAGDGGSPEVFTLIPSIRTIEGPGNAADKLDASTMDTPLGGKDWVQGPRDHGAFSFECLWDPGHPMHQQVYNDWKDGVNRNYQVIYTDPGSTTFAFRGFVESCPATAPHDNLLTQAVSIVIKGDPAPTLS